METEMKEYKQVVQNRKTNLYYFCKILKPYIIIIVIIFYFFKTSFPSLQFYWVTNVSPVAYIFANS